MATPYRICVPSPNRKKATSAEESKSELMERRMEQLKSTHHRSWAEYSKIVRSMSRGLDLNTYYIEHPASTVAPDFTDTGQIRQCLDALHMAITVEGRECVVERLEVISRHLSLAFDHTSPAAVSISSDMFHVDVFIEPQTGRVGDVKIAHHGEATSCHELLKLLSCGDFDTFKQHLEGLMKLYCVPGDKKSKMRAFISLQSLETDLSLLAQLQSSINGVANYIHKSPLGILIPRKAGRPMKLLYFVSPYDLLDKVTKSAHLMTVEVIMEHELGRSVTVCLEASSPTKLQSIPLMTINTSDGNSLPSFPPLNPSNSSNILACFVLLLSKPIPVSLTILRLIQALTNVNITSGVGNIQDLASLITDDMSRGQITLADKLYVTLPDQDHAYLLDASLTSMEAAPVTKIPFTHPTNVPQILGYLRQQLLFNTVIGSCVRSCANKDADERLMFEVKVVSIQHVSVLFEHPLCDSVATVEFDLSDITNLCVSVYIADLDDAGLSEHATQVFQRSMSIPLTMRAVILRCLPSLHAQIRCIEAARLAALVRQKTPPSVQQSFTNDNVEISPEYSDSTKNENVSRNPMLASLLVFETNSAGLPAGNGESDRVPAGCGSFTESPMLSELLREAEPYGGRINAASTKPRKSRKRKSMSDALPSPGMKGLMSPTDWDNNSGKRRNASGNSSTSASPPMTHSLDYAMNESHVSKLAHTIDSIIKSKASDTDGGTPMTATDASARLTSPTKRVTLTDLLADSPQNSPFALDVMNKCTSPGFRSLSRQSLNDDMYSRSFHSLDYSQPDQEFKFDRMPVSGRRSVDGIYNNRASPLSANSQCGAFTQPHVSPKFRDNFIRPIVHNMVDSSQISPKVPLNSVRGSSCDDGTATRVKRQSSSDETPKHQRPSSDEAFKRVSECSAGNCSDGENCPKTEDTSRTFVSQLEASVPPPSEGNNAPHGHSSPSTNRDTFFHPRLLNDLPHETISPCDNDTDGTGKIERLKKRDLKHKTDASESGKRKKVKDDFKKQRKKRKGDLEKMNATYKLDNTVYMSSIDEFSSSNNRQRMPKLRILKGVSAMLVENTDSRDQRSGKQSVDDSRDQRSGKQSVEDSRDQRSGKPSVDDSRDHRGGKPSVVERESVFNFDISEKADYSEKNDNYTPTTKPVGISRTKNSPKYLSAMNNVDLQPKVVIKTPTIRLKAVNVSAYNDVKSSKFAQVVETNVTSSASSSTFGSPVSSTSSMCAPSVTLSTSSVTITTASATGDAQVNKLTGRSRKGSLTAVIDKLTKASVGDALSASQDIGASKVIAGSAPTHESPDASVTASKAEENEQINSAKESNKSDTKDKIDTNKDFTLKVTNSLHLSNSNGVNSGNKASVEKISIDNKPKFADRPIYRSKSLNSADSAVIKASQNNSKTPTDKPHTDIKLSHNQKLGQATVTTTATTATTCTPTSVVDSVKTMTSSKVYKSQNVLNHSKGHVAIQPLSLSKGYKIPKCRPSVTLEESALKSLPTESTKLRTSQESPMPNASFKTSFSKDKYPKPKEFNQQSSCFLKSKPGNFDVFQRQSFSKSSERPPHMRSQNSSSKFNSYKSSPILSTNVKENNSSSSSNLDRKPDPSYPVNNFKAFTSENDNQLSRDSKTSFRASHNKSPIAYMKDKREALQYNDVVSEKLLTSDNSHVNSGQSNMKTTKPSSPKPTKSILVNKSKYDIKSLVGTSKHDSTVTPTSNTSKSPAVMTKSSISTGVNKSFSSSRSSPLMSSSPTVVMTSGSTKTVDFKVNAKVSASNYIPEVEKIRRDGLNVTRSPTLDDTSPRIPVLERLQLEYEDRTGTHSPALRVSNSPSNLIQNMENLVSNHQQMFENSPLQTSRNGSCSNQSQSHVTNMLKQNYRSSSHSPIPNMGHDFELGSSVKIESFDKSHILNKKTNAASGKNSPRHREENVSAGCLKSSNSHNMVNKAKSSNSSDVDDSRDGSFISSSDTRGKVKDIALPVINVIINGDIASPPSLSEGTNENVCPKMIPVPEDCLHGDDDVTSIKASANSVMNDSCISPISAASSPDNLIIDVPTTPKSAQRNSPFAMRKVQIEAVSTHTLSSPYSLVSDAPTIENNHSPPSVSAHTKHTSTLANTPEKLVIDLPSESPTRKNNNLLHTLGSNSLLSDIRELKPQRSVVSKNIRVPMDSPTMGINAVKQDKHEKTMPNADDSYFSPVLTTGSSPAAASPCMIDDDLMDEALGFAT